MTRMNSDALKSRIALLEKCVIENYEADGVVIKSLRSALSDCVESMKGYRREMDDNQPCDAEKAAMVLLLSE